MRFLALSLRQARYNLVAYLRSARTVVFALAMPVAFLVLFNSVFGGAGKTTSVGGFHLDFIAFFTGGLAAYGVVLGTFTGVLVAIVSAREAGWLKRFRGTPMPPGVFLAGQIGYLSVTELALVVVMLAVSVTCYGLQVHLVSVLAMCCYTLVGVFTFAALALALTAVVTTTEMASSVGPFTVVILSFVSGVFLPPALMPSWLTTLSTYLPLQPLAASMQRALASPSGTGFELRTFLVVAVWGVGAFAVAQRTFTWQPRRR